MCGRATLLSTKSQLEKRFNARYTDLAPLQENTNISAGEQLPVITCQSPNEIKQYTFGFTPSWAQKPTYMINARAEGSHNKENDLFYDGPLGIYQKPMFRKAIKSQRCLILVDGFIEGDQRQKLNKPYLIYPNKDQEAFALAGIYDTWTHPLTGKQQHTVAIVTTAANRLMKRIGHHRSPLVLTKKQEQQWLDVSTTAASLKQIMRPFDDRGFNAYPISNKIKNPRTNGIDILRPIGDKLYVDYNRSMYDRIKYVTKSSSLIRPERLIAGDQLALF